MSNELIRLVNCSMAFDGEIVLDDISININDKEFLTLIVCDALSQKELAQHYRTSQQMISVRINRIRQQLLPYAEKIGGELKWFILHKENQIWKCLYAPPVQVIITKTKSIGLKGLIESKKSWMNVWFVEIDTAMILRFGTYIKGILPNG